MEWEMGQIFFKNQPNTVLGKTNITQKEIMNQYTITKITRDLAGS